MSDIVELLRSWNQNEPPMASFQCTLDMQEAADEIERLRAQNTTLIDAINAAAALMASAPAWHAVHREAIAGLQRVKKEMLK